MNLYLFYYEREGRKKVEGKLREYMRHFESCGDNPLVVIPRGFDFYLIDIENVNIGDLKKLRQEQPSSQIVGLISSKQSLRKKHNEGKNLKDLIFATDILFEVSELTKGNSTAIHWIAQHIKEKGL
jgi:hypothetical protein